MSLRNSVPGLPIVAAPREEGDVLVCLLTIRK